MLPAFKAIEEWWPRLRQLPDEGVGALTGMADTVAGFQSKTLWTAAGVIVATIIGAFAQDIRQQARNNGEATALLSREVSTSMNDTRQAIVEMRGDLKQIPMIGAQISALEARIRVMEGGEAAFKAAIEGLTDRMDVHRRQLDSDRERIDTISKEVFDLTRTIIPPNYSPPTGIQRSPR